MREVRAADASLAYLYDPLGNVAEHLEFLFNNDTRGPPHGSGLYVQMRDYHVYDGYGALRRRVDVLPSDAANVAEYGADGALHRLGDEAWFAEVALL